MHRPHIREQYKIAVCHNKRIRRNRVFAGFAGTGKSSMGFTVLNCIWYATAKRSYPLFFRISE
jgi:hypothetical protein